MAKKRHFLEFLTACLIFVALLVGADLVYNVWLDTLSAQVQEQFFKDVIPNG